MNEHEKIMSDYLSALPIELIHTIFDSITTVDIFLSIALVNKRLYFVSLSYARLQLDSKNIGKKKKQFDLMCEQLPHLISRIVSLTFNDDQGTVQSNYKSSV